MAGWSATGQCCSQAPQPMHFVRSTWGCCRRTGIPSRSLTVTSSIQMAFFGVGQVSSQTMQGVAWAKGRQRPLSIAACPAHLLLLLKRQPLDRPRRAHLTAESAAEFAKPDPGHQHRRPEPLKTRLEERWLQPACDAHLHAFAASHTGLEKFRLLERPWRPDEFRIRHPRPR